MTYQFKIAFEVDPRSTRLPLKTYTREVYKRFVVTKDDSQHNQDADDGISHALVYNGKTLLVVDEQQENDADLGVKFVDIRRRNNGVIQGYIQITTKIGGPNIGGDEGYHVLYVPNLQSTPPPDPILPERPKSDSPIVQQSWNVKSIHSVSNNGSKSLVGNLVINNVEELKIANSQNLSTVMNKGNNEFQINNLPVLNQTTIEITDKSRKKSSIKQNGFALSSFLHEVNYSKNYLPDEEAWDKTIFSVLKKRIDLPADFGRSKSSSLSFTPVYSALRDGKPALEEGSSVTNYLNDAILQRSGSDIKKVYEDNNPFKFSWRFKVVNFITKKEVQVNTGEIQRDKTINIHFNTNSFKNDGLVISYPDNEIYEVEIELTISDIFGNNSSTTYVIWSHYINIQNNPNGIEQLSELTSNIIKSLNKQSIESSRKVSNTNERILEGLKLFFAQTIQDQKIMINELQAIIEVCKNLEK